MTLPQTGVIYLKDNVVIGIPGPKQCPKRKSPEGELLYLWEGNRQGLLDIILKAIKPLLKYRNSQTEAKPIFVFNPPTLIYNIGNPLT